MVSNILKIKKEYIIKKGKDIHGSYISSLVLLPNTSKVVLGLGDFGIDIAIWDLNPPRCVKKYWWGQRWSVESLAVAPTTGYAILAPRYTFERFNTIKIWDLNTGHCIRLQDDPDACDVRSIVVTPNEEHFITGALDGTISVWNTKTRQCKTEFNHHPFSVNALAVTPDGTSIVAAYQDSTLKLWDLNSGSCIRTFSFHGTVNGYQGILGYDFSRGSPTMEFPDADAELHKTLSPYNGPCYHDYTHGTLLFAAQFHEIEIEWRGHLEEVYAVSVLPNGKQMVSAGEDGTIQLWDIHNGQILQIIHNHLCSIKIIALSPDGTRLASTGSDRIVKIWDLNTGNLLCRFAPPPLPFGYGSGPKVTAFCWVNKQQILTADSARNLILWTLDKELD
ncbi:MAG: WD40 repeat domain-containing protein [Candidatus Helarchaeota archaeon]